MQALEINYFERNSIKMIKTVSDDALQEITFVCPQQQKRSPFAHLSENSCNLLLIFNLISHTKDNST